MSHSHTPPCQEQARQQRHLEAIMATIRGFGDAIGAHAQYLDDEGLRQIIPTLERTMVLLVAEIALGRSRTSPSP